MTVTPALLRQIYPEFACVDDAVIEFWLGKAELTVTDAWGEDQEEGLLLLTAHKVKVSGVVTGGADDLPAGVTRFRSASIDVAISEAAANRALGADYGSTSYGQLFRPLLRRHCGLPRLVGYVEPRCYP
jgi:hypothetical protein